MVSLAQGSFSITQTKQLTISAVSYIGLSLVEKGSPSTSYDWTKI